MKNTPLVIEETFNASVERVWQAITDKDKMKHWYFDLAEFKAEVGFEFTFSGEGSEGEKYIHFCKVTEVIPNKKIQYSWRYENYKGNSLVTFELFEDGNKTTLRLTHEGLETFPQDNLDFSTKSFTEGWTDFITKSLPKFLEQLS